MAQIIVEIAGARLDAFLAENCEFSRSHIKKMIDDGLVTVNLKNQKGKYIVKEGDVIEYQDFQPQPYRRKLPQPIFRRSFRILL